MEQDRLEHNKFFFFFFLVLKKNILQSSYCRKSESESTTSVHQSSRAGGVTEKTITTMGDSMITPSIEYDYLIKFLALGDSGVGMNKFLSFFSR